MRGSIIALLLLAASAAVPALSAPLSSADVPGTADVVARNSTLHLADEQAIQDIIASRSLDGLAYDELVARGGDPITGVITLLGKLASKIPGFGRDEHEIPIELLARGGDPITGVITLLNRIGGKLVGKIPGLGRDEHEIPIELLARGGDPITGVITLLNRIGGKLVGKIPGLGRDDHELEIPIGDLIQSLGRRDASEELFARGNPITAVKALINALKNKFPRSDEEDEELAVRELIQGLGLRGVDPEMEAREGTIGAFFQALKDSFVLGRDDGDVILIPAPEDSGKDLPEELTIPARRSLDALD